MFGANLIVTIRSRLWQFLPAMGCARASLLITFLMCGSAAVLAADNAIVVERYQAPPPSTLSVQFLSSQALATTGFAPVSASKMLVKRDQFALWRIRIEQLSTPVSDVLLVLNNSFDRDVHLYYPPDYQAQMHHLFDTRKPSEHSRFRLAMPLPPQIKTNDVLYLAMPVTAAAPIELQLMDRMDYARQDANLVRLHTAILSMLIASCAVALCFFLVLKERVWLCFIAYAAALIGYVLTRTGELIAMLGTTSIDRWTWQAATVFSLATAALLAFFVLEFLKLKSTMPRVANAFRAYGIVMLMLAVVAMVPAIANSNLLSITANSVLLLGIALTLYAAIASLRQGFACGSVFFDCLFAAIARSNLDRSAHARCAWGRCLGQRIFSDQLCLFLNCVEPGDG